MYLTAAACIHTRARARTHTHTCVTFLHVQLVLGKLKTALKKADTQDEDDYGRTVLHYAAWGGNLSCVSYLMSVKAVATLDNDGNSPLMLAVKYRNGSYLVRNNDLNVLSKRCLGIECCVPTALPPAPTLYLRKTAVCCFLGVVVLICSQC